MTLQGVHGDSVGWMHSCMQAQGGQREKVQRLCKWGEGGNVVCEQRKKGGHPSDL